MNRDQMIAHLILLGGEPYRDGSSRVVWYAVLFGRTMVVRSGTKLWHDTISHGWHDSVNHHVQIPRSEVSSMELSLLFGYVIENGIA